ncbi:hypothetical protein INS49_011672 [Diaporthe citri]|uniref:uncharacterized protein n=1 Tax=Diaporthe citri TaxID=83186 RepID=UPI001C81626D|nr:uncharacterized protein INS49_011672 [Diaporthe citri]KAG6360608.1 hypothetical protein INS49_011672 [Diaporthe citri]
MRALSDFIRSDIALTISILLLGDEAVGKTTFLSRISQGHNNLVGTRPINLLKDIDQPYVFETSFGRQQYRLEFYDTSSPENWRLLRPDLVLICYDISQRLSLINLQRVWIKEVRSTFLSESTLPLAVLGLKRDLRSEDDPNGIIYPQEAYRIAAEIRADKYMECSAVTGELLQLAFEEICQMAVKTTSREGGQSDGGCRLM